MNEMWKDLSSTSRLLWNSASSCEAELHDLMLQIDKMVQEKKIEWEHDLQIVESRLAAKESESHVLQTTVDERNQEVSQLRRRLEDVEGGHKSSFAEYESQTNYLRKEVMQMSKNYERLQKKFMKQTRDLEKDKEKLATEMEQILGERKNMESKLEEFKRREWEWEQERTGLQRQVDQLSCLRQSLEEKYAFLQHQTVGYQTQLDKRKALLENSETSLKGQISQLEGELVRTRDSNSKQAKQLETVKASLENASTSYKKASDDKELLENDVRAAKKTVLRLEDELSRVSRELGAKEKALQRVEQDLRAKVCELRLGEETIREKNDFIKAMEAAPQQKDYAGMVAKLEKELYEARMALKTQKRNMKRLGEDNELLTRRVEDTEARCVQLETTLAKKKEEFNSKQSAEAELLREEIKKLRTNQSKSENRHSEDLAQMRRSIGQLEEELRTSRRSEGHLVDKLSDAERRILLAQEDLERRSSELQVANAQLEALRLENRHLRSVADKAGESAADEMAQAQEHLQQLQNAYTARLKQAEREKAEMQEEMSSRTDSCKERVDELTSCVAKLEKEKMALTRQVDRQTEHLLKLTQENTALQSFAANIHDTISSPSGSDTRIFHPLRPQPAGCGDGPTLRTPRRRGQMNNHSLSTTRHDDPGTSAVSDPGHLTQFTDNSITWVSGGEAGHDDFDETLGPSSAAKFYAEEQQRSRQLEALIDSHIEDLKTETERAINSLTASGASTPALQNGH